MKVASLPLAIALSAASTASLGQISTARSATEDANVNLIGDYLKFNVDMEGFTPKSDGPAPTTGTLVAPKGSCFRISEELLRQDPSHPNDRSKDIKYVRGTFVSGWATWRPLPFPPYDCPEIAQKSGGINPRVPYDVPKDVVVRGDRDRHGWTYGILVAPFKFYASEREFSAGAMVGPYLGYRFSDRPGGSVIFGVAAGASNATIKTNNADGTETSTEKNGMAFAVTAQFDIKSDFNVGLIAGWDYFSRSDNIPNSGKLWLSLSFGKKLD